MRSEPSREAEYRPIHRHVELVERKAAALDAFGLGRCSRASTRFSFITAKMVGLATRETFQSNAWAYIELDRH